MLLSRPLLFALALLLPAVLAAPTTPTTGGGVVRYDNQVVVRFPSSADLAAKLEGRNLDIWARNSRGIDVRLTRDQLEEIARSEGLTYTILIEDVQAAVDEERKRLQSNKRQVEESLGGRKVRTSLSNQFYFADYHPYEEIKTFISDLSKTYPTLVSYEPSIGKSVEGRDIPLLRITGTGGNLSSKKRVWFQSLQHAREWISGATTQYIAFQLASLYGKDPRVTKLMDQIEFVIAPVANPDGYTYTWTKDRMWRKNRAVINGHVAGVDINRNWPDHWGRDDGSSGDPRGETYRGPSAASEPEIKTLIKAFTATPNIIAAIDFHSYSQAILRPYGWGEEKAFDDDRNIELSNKLVAEIAKPQGTQYTPMTKLYPVSGGARDWFYGMSTKVGEQKKYGFTIELSPSDEDPNDWGFILPPKEILRVGNELWNAMLVFCEDILSKPLGVKTKAEEL